MIVRCLPISLLLCSGVTGAVQVAALPTASAQDTQPTEQLMEPAHRTVQLRFEVRNKAASVAENVEAGVLVPVQQAAGQRCCIALESSHQGTVIRDVYGNQALLFRFDRLPPHATKTVQVRATLTAASTALARPAVQETRWLSAEPLIEAQHADIRDLARRLQSGNAIETARRIHNWVAGNVEYAGYLRHARGALYALEHKRGDCTESMHLFVALARASAIPARGMAGYVISRDQPIRAKEFHNWAEFYTDGAWRIADPQRKQFDTGYGHYVATRILGIDSGPIPADANRFWAVGEGVQTRME